MRPDAEADGLICIIAHDNSIVKIKISIWYSVAVVDYELCIYLTPVLTASSPLFRNVLHSQIQHLEKTVIGRKYGL